MDVTVSFATGQSFSLCLQPTDSVESLKEAVHALADVPMPQQVVTVGNVELREDRRTIGSYGIQDGTRVAVAIVPSRAQPQDYVVTRCSDTVSVSVRRYDTVGAVKQAACGALLRLCSHGEEMEDAHTLAFYNASQELQALRPADFCVRLKSACGKEAILVTNEEETTAMLKEKALRLCPRIPADSSQLRVGTERLDDVRRVVRGEDVWLDRPLQAHLKLAYDKGLELDCYYFETTSEVIARLADMLHCPAALLRLYTNRASLLGDTDWVGEALATSYYLYVVKQTERILTVQTSRNPQLIVVLPDYESLEAVRSQYGQLEIKEFVLSGSCVDMNKPISALQIESGAAVETACEVSIARVEGKTIKLQVRFPATLHALKSQLEAHCSVPVAHQRLFYMQRDGAASEVTSPRGLSYIYENLTLLLPSELVLRITRTDKRFFDIPAALQWTVAELKQRIERAYELKGEEQTLRVNGDVLADTVLLRDCQLQMFSPVALFLTGERVVIVRTSDEVQTECIVRGEPTVRSFLGELRYDSRFWFKYKRSALRLSYNGVKLRKSEVISHRDFADGSVLSVTAAGEVVLVIESGEKLAVTQVFDSSETVRKVKGIFGWYIDSGKRPDKLFWNRIALEDEQTLAECGLCGRAKLEYLPEHMDTLVHIRESDGTVFNVSLSEGDADVLALKRRILYKKSVRLHQQKLVYNGRLLSDGQKLSALGVSMWSLFSLITAPVDILLWVKCTVSASFLIGVSRTSTVLSIKSHIAAFTGAPIDSIRVASSSRILPSDTAVASLGFRSAQTILALLPSDALVVVKTPSGTEVDFAVRRSATVEEVKEAVERKTGFLRRKVRLRFCGRHLPPSTRISVLEFADYLSLFLSFRRP